MESKIKTNYRFGHDYGPLFAEELRHQNIKSGARVLNIACEDELQPPFLRKFVQKGDVYGVDIDQQVIDNDHIKYCNVDKDALPFDDNSFEVIVSIWGVEHFTNHKIFEECKRVLKPGGQFIFVTPNVVNPIFLFNRSLQGRMSKPYFKYILRTKYVPHQTFYKNNRMGTLRKSAQASGLIFKKLSYFGPSYVIYYFNFSKALQGIVKKIDKIFLNNPLFYRLKPYLVGVLQKPL